MTNNSLIFDEGVEQSLETIRQYCLAYEHHIAVAESVTSGALQLLLSTAENAGMFFSGGITMYSCAQKANLLSIPTADCEKCSGVSMEIAEKLALRVCEKFESELGLSVTGFASPIPEKGVFELYAIASFSMNGQTVFTELLKASKTEQLDVQLEYAGALLALCRKYLGPRLPKK
nr:hypothetical protein [Cytophagales bacterium]